MATSPVFPVTAEPELNASRPLPPLAPPFVEVTLMIPLLARTSSLETTAVGPPPLALPRPDTIVEIAPTPLVPLPTITCTDPPRPLVLMPTPMVIRPLFPRLLNPELKAS
jgi:hypothetical protein